MTVASKRPDLAPGASYGEDITLADLRIGDEFYAPQTPRRAQIGGTIEKLSRVTLGYKTLYMERIEMHLTTRKTELVGGYVLRGKVVHMIVVPPSGAPRSARQALLAVQAERGQEERRPPEGKRDGNGILSANGWEEPEPDR